MSRSIEALNGKVKNLRIEEVFHLLRGEQFRLLIFKINIAAEQSGPADDQEDQQPQLFFARQGEAPADPDQQFFKNGRYLLHSVTLAIPSTISK